MASKGNTCYFCAAQFRALEAVEIGCASGEFLFEVVGVNDYGEGFLGGDSGRGADETLE